MTDTMEYEVSRNPDGSWVISGEGHMRPIVVEGETLAIAKQNWVTEFGKQYEEMEQHTARAVQHLEKNSEDYRRLAAEMRGYKGTF